MVMETTLRRPEPMPVEPAAKTERMKAIASSARKEMEALFGGKVFLQIWVKVRRGWADDAGQLQRFGYG